MTNTEQIAAMAERIEKLERQLKYALDNIEGCINETDLPSTAILRNGRALLSSGGQG